MRIINTTLAVATLLANVSLQLDQPKNQTITTQPDQFERFDKNSDSPDDEIYKDIELDIPQDYDEIQAMRKAIEDLEDEKNSVDFQSFSTNCD